MNNPPKKHPKTHESTDGVRIHWECPRCSREYWVPTTEGLTYCPKCRPSLWHFLRKVKCPSVHAILVSAAALTFFVLGVGSGSGEGLLTSGYVCTLAITVISYACGKLNGFEFSFILLTLWFVGQLSMVPSQYEIGAKLAVEGRHFTPAEAAEHEQMGGTIRFFMSLFMIVSIYVFCLVVLAFAKYFLSRPEQATKPNE